MSERLARAVPWLCVYASGACARVGWDVFDHDDPLPLVVAPAYPVHGARWNSYVSASEADDLPCDPPRDALCLHGGERREVVMPHAEGCDGLQLIEELAAFEWRCVERGDAVAFLSTGLRAERGLRDLVRPHGWLHNAVRIMRAGETVLGASDPSAWWDNPVAALPPSPDVDGGAAELVAEGTIYVGEGSVTTGGYNIGADGVAIVVTPGGELVWDNVSGRQCAANGERGTEQSCLIAVGSQRFVWIEARTNGGATGPAAVGIHVLVALAQYVRLHQVESAGGGAGLRITGSRHVTVDRTAAHSSAGVGIELFQTSDSRLVRVAAVHHALDGIRIIESARTVLSQLESSNNRATGIYIEASPGVVGTSLRTTHNGVKGLHYVGGSDSTFINVAALSNGDSGLEVSTSDGLVVAQAVTVSNSTGFRVDSSSAIELIACATAHHGQYGLLLSNAVARIADYLLVGANGQHCLVNAGAPNVTDGSCAPTPADAFELVTGVDLTATFLGRAGSDAANAHGRALAAGTLPYEAITDWLRFDSSLRSWGNAGEIANMWPTSRGPCAAGTTCAIWDWRLAPADTWLRDRNGTAVDAAACPASVHGDRAVFERAGAPIAPYLRHAVELLDDASGDDDGLCESGETCVYSPHVGVYQGESSGSAARRCVFTDGRVTEVDVIVFL